MGKQSGDKDEPSGRAPPRCGTGTRRSQACVVVARAVSSQPTLPEKKQTETHWASFSWYARRSSFCTLARRLICSIWPELGMPGGEGEGAVSTGEAGEGGREERGLHAPICQ